MTKENFIEKIDYMLNDGTGIKDVIRNACISTMNSEEAKGRYLNEYDDDFILPKIVLTAVLEELAWQYEPFDKVQKKVVDRVKLLVRF